MPSVDLVCTYDSANSDAWTSGASISVNDGTSASFTQSSGVYAKLGFTTDVATALPAGAIITAAQLIIKIRTTVAGAALVYIKDPGGFVDGGASVGTINFNSATLTLYTGADVGAERPATLVAANWSSGAFVRMIQTSGSARTFNVDYLSIRLTYTMPAAGNAMFFGENF